MSKRLLAMGVVLALALAPQAIGQADDAHPKPNGAQHEQRNTSVPAAVPPPACRNACEGHAGQDQGEKKSLTIYDHIGRWLWRMARDPIAVLTLLLFLIGGLQFREMNLTAKRQLRAYISAVPNFIVAFGLQSYCGVRIGLRNDGLTPAFSLVHKIGITLVPYPISDEVYLPEPSGKPGPPFVLFPRDTVTANYTNDRHFTEEEIAQIAAATLAIVVFGLVTYRDIYGGKHWTKFASYVAADIPTLIKLSSNYEPSDLKLSFTIVPSGSDADR